MSHSTRHSAYLYIVAIHQLKQKNEILNDVITKFRWNSIRIALHTKFFKDGKNFEISQLTLKNRFFSLSLTYCYCRWNCAASTSSTFYILHSPTFYILIYFGAVCLLLGKNIRTQSQNYKLTLLFYLLTKLHIVHTNRESTLKSAQHCCSLLRLLHRVNSLSLTSLFSFYYKMNVKYKQTYMWRSIFYSFLQHLTRFAKCSSMCCILPVS
jgi:hypothetical protein